jgi:large subunit ribosomal protein L9
LAKFGIFGYNVFSNKFLLNMRVVLLKDVKGLGKSGDIKDVPDGYARNFLLPSKSANIASTGAVKIVELQKQKQAEIAQKELAETQELASRLQGKEIVVKAKEKNGKLFGSITAKNITKELKKDGIDVAEKSIVISENVREIGEYAVKVRLDHGIEAEMLLFVESEK